MIDWSVIRQEYEQGSSLRVLAAKHGVGKSTIARKLALQAASWYNEAAKNVVPGGAANTPGRIHSRRNVPMDTLPPHDLDGNPIPEKRSTDWRKIRFEYEAGSSLRMLAARYNMGKSTIAERKLKERWTQDELKEQCVKGKRWTFLKAKGYQSSTSLYSIYSLT